MGLPQEELQHWMAWQEGWDIWKELLELDSLLHPIHRSVKGPIPDVEPFFSGTMTDSVILKDNRLNLPTIDKQEDMTLNAGEDIDSDLDLEVEVLGSQSASMPFLKNFIKRNFTRYKKQLKVVITGTEGQKFETMSVDISVGGILVHDPLPTWVVGYNQVKIVNLEKKQAIEVTCSVVDDQDPHKRIRLEILPLKKKEEELHFDKWLAA